MAVYPTHRHRKGGARGARAPPIFSGGCRAPPIIQGCMQDEYEYVQDEYEYMQVANNYHWHTIYM